MKQVQKPKKPIIDVYKRQFQDFNLLDTFSLRDNIYLPLVLEGKKYEEMSLRAEPIAKKLGITQILNK